jgi:hypothetical protein
MLLLRIYFPEFITCGHLCSSKCINKGFIKELQKCVFTLLGGGGGLLNTLHFRSHLMQIKKVCILWHVDLLLGNSRDVSS